MQVRIKSDVLLELTSNIVAYINDERNMGHWKTMWAWNVYNRAETLKAMCQAAESMAGDGWVKLHPKDIEILEWYDADWINQYLE